MSIKRSNTAILIWVSKLSELEQPLGLSPLLIDQSKGFQYITLLADYQCAIPTPKIDKNSEHYFWLQPELVEFFSEFSEKSYRTIRVNSFKCGLSPATYLR